jgi:hypothetical protein
VTSREVSLTDAPPDELAHVWGEATQAGGCRARRRLVF